MDLHQKEIQGFFNFPIDNLRASPFLIQYIQEEVHLVGGTHFKQFFFSIRTSDFSIWSFNFLEINSDVLFKILWATMTLSLTRSLTTGMLLLLQSLHLLLKGKRINKYLKNEKTIHVDLIRAGGFTLWKIVDAVFKSIQSLFRWFIKNNFWFFWLLYVWCSSVSGPKLTQRGCDLAWQWCTGTRSIQSLTWRMVDIHPQCPGPQQDTPAWSCHVRPWWSCGVLTLSDFTFTL